ncbi:uncharacterized protein BP5553_04078 [Venustampulla echinocandica]|uniref:Autophagy-related protein 16 domain-containing protein n=1 Tax=Venustampulla echinocandica TaxID=2656787 RepID=A0A370TW84_9HELO|nr:uncharacterized protein BP5553_04078 [Venustampulla echinocandica]RDL39738.1 hypothetical protein BP5553_04078 [Venustampulla echinocandica]
MASWREEYIQALQERDEREKASYQRIDDELINAFADLLARTSALEAEKAANDPAQDSKSPGSAIPTAAAEGSAQEKSHLAGALRQNGQLQSRIKLAEAELVKLRTKTRTDAKLIESLSRERASLSQKVKDRDEELRGKAKLLDKDVHDEVISLNLQLNMSEKNVKKLKTENKELIDRWMIHKGREAEAMNNTLHDQSEGR